jgi:hypothetical protein
MTDLFGLATSDLEMARAVVEPILGVEMDAHESSYRCGDYYVKRLPNGNEYSLQKNYDRVHDEWRYDEYKEMGALLFVSVKDAASLEEVSARLKSVDGVVHLHRESFSEEDGYRLVRVYKGMA